MFLYSMKYKYFLMSKERHNLICIYLYIYIKLQCISVKFGFITVAKTITYFCKNSRILSALPNAIIVEFLVPCRVRLKLNVSDRVIYKYGRVLYFVPYKGLYSPHPLAENSFICFSNCLLLGWWLSLKYKVSD